MFNIFYLFFLNNRNGMISREEMKNYFLKVNYHALKTEFKHVFDEHTYLKPTFCAHCKGFVSFMLNNVQSERRLLSILEYFLLPKT
jgi:hypothetical protein